ncbi:MAG TPA: triose-phosphate isomerase [Anaerolineales bacterium]|nr:triose-phosphate isomerase [Anaerolineales bacterium]
MRKPFVAGNWKMNKTVAEARHLVSELVPVLQEIQGVEKVLCPTFPCLLPVSALLEGTGIGLGAQNMYWQESGAYTGEISPSMVAEFCQYVILGHSERRKYFSEMDETVNLKVKAALKHNLIPIVCVGETLEEYEAGLTAEVVSRQIRQGLVGIGEVLDLTNHTDIVVAYEPVWAIGTGKPSTAEGASQVISKVIRKTLAELFGEAFSQKVRVLYGGSVTGSNAAEYFSDAEIDGALVGGASLKVSDFSLIVKAAAQ